MKYSKILLTVILVVITFNLAIAQEPKNFDNDLDNYEWKVAAKQLKLSDEDMEKLEKQKILMTNRTGRQVFEFYPVGNIPVFITSDSLINAYNVLFAESLLRMEKVKSRELGGILRFIWENLETVDKRVKEDPQKIKSAKKRAQIIIGVALKLIGDNSVKIPDNISPAINQEVKRIKKAKAKVKPDWLGKPDPEFLYIDYSRYKPRGFYTGSSQLQKYFRAISWLQSIPFRVKKDDELLTILLLGNCIAGQQYNDYEQRWKHEEFLKSYTKLAGIADNWTIIDAAEVAQNLNLIEDPISKIQKRLAGKAYYETHRFKINDQAALKIPKEITERISFRIISPLQLPDALMFQKTMDLEISNRAYPSSLEICAVLGSSYAKSFLLKYGGKKLVNEIDKCEKFFDDNTLYCEYLYCLSALVDKPEKDAPAFMKSSLWEIKSCQAVLSGWVQMRRSFVLHAKQNFQIIGKLLVPPGFVEPEPEFFGRMGRLAHISEIYFQKSGAFKNKSNKEIASEIRELADVLVKLELTTRKQRKIDISGLTKNELRNFGNNFDLFNLYLLENYDSYTPAYYKEAVKRLRKSADELETSKKLTYKELVALFKIRQQNIKPLWKRLQILSIKLEALARKFHHDFK